MVRLWVGGEDYGTMSEKAANLYKIEHARMGETETIRIETVSDDAPKFLPVEDGTGTP